ncbi:MAG: undecaprenyl/decaprenyl-phosphate alpha-N-acetylglucosaminyl 1-phosphate transferase [Calditrichaeota bacterium]|nr:undecaprenyl/decaprenyl-phosphate alpha-N-acetylglucosaminyl 1-phosphate transferase [Calditrichota bacterium]
MRLLALTLVSAFFTTVAMTLIVKKVAIHRQLFARSNGRSIHSKPTPVLGGVAIFVAFVVSYIVIFTFATSALAPLLREMFVFLTGGLVILGLGVYDDIFGATWYQKFIVEFLAGAIVLFAGYQISALNFFPGQSVNLGWLGVPFTLMWIIAITNAINLIDGLDGLAAGVSLLAALAMMFISLWFGNIASAFPAAILAGSLAAFLIFNFNPAKIFLGDSGSLFLGFMLACFSINGTFRNNSGVALYIPIIVLGIPITDMLLAFFRRLAKGVNPFQADREHIHHQLLYLGLSHRSAMLLINFVSLCWGAIGVFLYISPGRYSYALLLIIFLTLALGIQKLGFFRYFVLTQK